MPPESADYVWLSQADKIQKALDAGQGQPVSSFEMLQRIKAGRHSLWAVHDGDEVVAVIVLSVLGQGTDNKKLFVELMAGDRVTEWEDQLEELVIDCRDLIGAKSVEASCRVGLAELMARRNTGWRKKAIVMELK